MGTYVPLNKVIGHFIDKVVIIIMKLCQNISLLLVQE
jgi:hypothetical protein